MPRAKVTQTPAQGHHIEHPLHREATAATQIFGPRLQNLKEWPSQFKRVFHSGIMEHEFIQGQFIDKSNELQS